MPASRIAYISIESMDGKPFSGFHAVLNLLSFSLRLTIISTPK